MMECGGLGRHFYFDDKHTYITQHSNWKQGNNRLKLRFFLLLFVSFVMSYKKQLYSINNDTNLNHIKSYLFVTWVYSNAHTHTQKKNVK